MGLSGALFKASKMICPICNKPLYADPKDRKKKHSLKEFIKCLYTAHVAMNEALEEIEQLKSQKETFDKIIVDEKGKVIIDGEKAGEIKKEKTS